MYHFIRSLTSASTIMLTVCGCASEHQVKPSSSTPAPLTPAPGPAQTRDPGASAVGGDELRRADAVQKPITVSHLGIFGDWDANANGQIELQEFQSRLQRRNEFGEYDTNRDRQLGELEFTTALYHAWDVDGDNLVDVYEYRNGQGAWFVDGRFWTMFEDWDADGDKELTLVELQPQGQRLLSSFDANGDGTLDEAEFSTRRYKAWDVNDDGIVDIYEFNRIGDPKTNTPRSSTNRKSSQKGSKDAPMVATYGSFYVYDLDRDSKVTLNEFRETLARTSMFDDWKSIERGDPTNPDYRRRLFEFWDLDGDDQVGLFEFRHGAGVFFPSVDTYGNFVAWDANKDTRLTKQEFVDYAGKTRLPQDWKMDTNQDLEATELDVILYEAWDLDGDGSLEIEEWRWR